MGRAFGTALLLLPAPPALGHGAGPVAPGDVWTHWSLDPWTILPLLAASLLYGRGVSGLWRRLGRRTPALRGRHVAAFAAGVLVLVIALVSPLAELSGALLSAHMVQHVLLVAVAPPLLLLGKPDIAWLWGLPAGWRRGLAWGLRGAAMVFAPLARPVPASLVHAAVLWAWHAPAAFEAALGNEALHVLEHTLFLGTALLFWRGLVRATGHAAAAGLAASLVTLLQGGFLGALFSLSGVALYVEATRSAPLWGLTPLADQQLAGLIMWVPAGTIYLMAGLAMAARLLAPSSAPGLGWDAPGGKP